MKASPEIMVYAKAMLAVYIGLGILSLVLTIRSLHRPIDATREKAARLKRLIPLCSGFTCGALATAVDALVSKQYYLFGASALLLILGFPILLQYIRVRLALRETLHPDAPAPKI